MAHTYLIRYGSMARVGKFTADSAGYARGQTVVVRSERGTELGEVLIDVASPPAPLPGALPAASARILRAAGPGDLERARLAQSLRSGQLAVCQKVFEDGVWPLELVDVEPLLDDRRTVLHYLGPHRLDTAGLRSAFRASCGLDVVLEPVGRDVGDDDEVAAEPGGCGHCGSGEGSCGSGGGCGSREGSSAHGGCSDCGVKKLLAERRAARAG